MTATTARRRNPWNEFECGSHYARSLASWAVLTALSGYEFDLPNKTLGFTPRLYADSWRAFWSADGAWGLYEQEADDGRGHARLSLAYGSTPLERLVLGSFTSGATVRATVAGRDVPATATDITGRLAVHLPTARAWPRASRWRCGWGRGLVPRSETGAGWPASAQVDARP